VGHTVLAQATWTAADPRQMPRTRYCHAQRPLRHHPAPAALQGTAEGPPAARRGLPQKRRQSGYRGACGHPAWQCARGAWGEGTQQWQKGRRGRARAQSPPHQTCTCVSARLPQRRAGCGATRLSAACAARAPALPLRARGSGTGSGRLRGARIGVMHECHACRGAPVLRPAGARTHPRVAPSSHPLDAVADTTSHRQMATCSAAAPRHHKLPACMQSGERRRCMHAGVPLRRRGRTGVGAAAQRVLHAGHGLLEVL
jgi:hypothetical protein